MTGQLVVDADGHIFEPDDVWTKRMDARRWRDWIPHKELHDGCYEITYTGGVVRSGGRELQDRMAAAVGLSPQEFYDLTISLRRPGGNEPAARLADMDADGIDVLVAYPTAGLAIGLVPEEDYATALAGFYPRQRPILLGLAAAVGLSRVYLGHHFVSDVLVGAGLGAGLGALAGGLLGARVRQPADLGAAAEGGAADGDRTGAVGGPAAAVPDRGGLLVEPEQDQV